MDAQWALSGCSDDDHDADDDDGDVDDDDDTDDDDDSYDEICNPINNVK